MSNYQWFKVFRLGSGLKGWRFVSKVAASDGQEAVYRICQRFGLWDLCLQAEPENPPLFTGWNQQLLLPGFEALT